MYPKYSIIKGLYCNWYSKCKGFTLLFLFVYLQDIAQLIVERTTVINYILPMDSSPRSPEQLNTLEALIQLFVNYLHTAKEPDTEGYSWVSAGCLV